MHELSIVADQNICMAFSGCGYLDTEECNDCLSGQRECEKLDNQCWIKGLCQGNSILEVNAFLPKSSFYRKVLGNRFCQSIFA